MLEVVNAHLVQSITIVLTFGEETRGKDLVHVKIQHSIMGQMLIVKAALINVPPALEVKPIVYLVQKVVLDQTVHALMLHHSMMGPVLHVNVLPLFKIYLLIVCHFSCFSCT